MSETRRCVVPLSQDPQRRQRQLANLRRGRPRAPSLPESVTGLELRLERLTPASSQVRRVVRELLSLQHEMAQPTESDAPLVASLAQVLVVMRMALAELLRHGLTDPSGRERPAARIFLQAADVAGRLCDRLAIGPAARAKLGLGGTKSLRDLLAEALTEEVKADGSGQESGDVAA